MIVTAQPTGILEYRIYGQDGEFVQLTCQDTPSLRRFVEWVRIHDRRSPSQMAKGEGASGGCRVMIRSPAFSQTASGVTQKNGGTPEGVRQGKSHMLNVAEKPEKSILISTQSPEKRTAMWLAEHVAKSKNKITTVVDVLTPALATVLLDRNEDNRRVNDVLVEAYARDMLSGKWHMNGEPIIIAANGMMNDGQHRCLAVIDACVAVPMVFVFGVERESRTTVDQGRVRTVSDYLTMNGHTNTMQLAAAAGYIWQHTNRGMLSSSGQQKPTKSEVLDLINTHPNIAESVEFANRKGADAVGGKSILGFCHWTFARQSNVAAADQFIVAITQGAGLFDRDPVLYARNRLIQERGRLRPNDKAELIFRAWNAHRRRETIRSFPILGGVLPVVEK